MQSAKFFWSLKILILLQIFAYYIPQHPGPLIILLPSHTGVTIIFVFILSFMAPTREITPIIFPSCRSQASVVRAVSRESSSRVPKPSSRTNKSTLKYLHDILNNSDARTTLTMNESPSGGYQLHFYYNGASLKPDQKIIFT